METFSNKDRIILGRGKGIEILYAIKNAKTSVKVVSPYLSPDYIKELIKLREKGIDITLITCDNLEVNSWSDFRHSDVIKQEKTINKESENRKKSLKKISLAFFIISILSFVFTFAFAMPEFIYFSIILLFISIIFFGYQYMIEEYKYNYYSIFKLKVFDSKSGANPQSTNLIHSKIFLIDDKILFLGSANFTYSAFKTHYETIIRVEDEFAVRDISQEIENIFNSTDLKEKSIEEWGRSIYE